jgi:glycosyltransferase involved in cell wall biosynthesis
VAGKESKDFFNDVIVNQISNDTERLLKEPPLIQAVADNFSRPKWSVMIPVYNCARFLSDTLRSVLVQARDEADMQIEVVDDCSTDADVEKIVWNIGKGRIKYFRQTINVGSLRNFLTCLQRSRGYLIHLLHGDDMVRPGFYKTMQNFLDREKDLGAAYCRFAYVDDQGAFMRAHELEMAHEGVLDNWLERISERQRIQYVAMVVRRSVYEQLGGFYGVEYGEDWEMWVRIAAHFKVGYVPTILALYRRHPSSISGRSFITGRNMDELKEVMKTIQNYVPKEKQKIINDKSRKFYANYAIRVARTLWVDLRNKQGAIAQLRAAWNMQKDPYLLLKILKLYTRMTLNI